MRAAIYKGPGNLVLEVYTLNTFGLNELTIKNNSEITSGGTDVVIECVGPHKAAELTLMLPKSRGRIIISGLSEKNDSVNYNLRYSFSKEPTIRGSLINSFTFPRSIELIISGKTDVASFGTVTATIDDLNKIIVHPRDYSVTIYQITPYYKGASYEKN